MKRIFVILLVIHITIGVSKRHGSRVWGGQNATSGQFPYTVSVNNPFQNCGGIIIAPNWILTAAQCIYYVSPRATVYIGSHINEVNGTAYRISNTIIHDHFDSWSFQNDIALIKLNTDLVFSDTIQAIEFSEIVPANTTCTVVGWGSTHDNTYPDNLQYAETTVIDLELCQNITDGKLLEAYLGPEQVCTLAPEGQGACFRDTGGPLICGGQLTGIISYPAGFSCGTEMPNVYTSISAYLNWILTLIQP